MADEALQPTGDDLAMVEATNYFAVVPEWVITSPDLSSGAVRVYCILRRHADKATGVAFPFLTTIAKQCGKGEKGKDHPSTVTIKRYIDELVAVGAVTRRRRQIPGTKRATSNVYVVHESPTFAPARDDYKPGQGRKVK